MGYILSGEPPIEVILRESRRATRISLRVSHAQRQVTLTHPRGIKPAMAIAFAEEKNDWIRKSLAEIPKDHLVSSGSLLPLKGRPHQIQWAGPGRASVAVSDDDILRITGAESRIGPILQGWLKTEARHLLAQASARYAAQLGLRHGRITLRDTRSRWGSCSSRGDLMYSWRLIMAPVDVRDYVVAHEVAHLRYLDHSAAFWACVRELYGNHDAQRRWLRQHGSDLHRYKFLISD